MGPANSSFELISLSIQIFGTLLFGLVFLFLWRQSGMMYFGLWSMAWAAQAASLVFGFRFFTTRGAVWLAPYAFCEFIFAVLLVAAARAGFSGSIRSWRSALKILLAFPLFLALMVLIGWRGRLESYGALHAIVLCPVYLYSYAGIQPRGAGGKVFGFSLLCLSAASLHHAVLFLYLVTAGSLPAWARYLDYNLSYDFALQALLAFAGMAMWIESQNERVRELAADLDRAQREGQRSQDLDRLTGLLNQSALAQVMEAPERFSGVVAVCDMDNFKEVNDRYGHLTGDEILRNIGNLLRSSIRQEDAAFRWGGDEFVILFRNQKQEVVRKRMGEVEERLRDFRVRGHGVLPISFSWGTSEAVERPLREMLDEADRDMYALKRQRAEQKAR